MFLPKTAVCVDVPFPSLCPSTCCLRQVLNFAANYMSFGLAVILKLSVFSNQLYDSE